MIRAFWVRKLTSYYSSNGCEMSGLLRTHRVTNVLLNKLQTDSQAEITRVPCW